MDPLNESLPSNATENEEDARKVTLGSPEVGMNRSTTDGFKDDENSGSSNRGLVEASDDNTGHTNADGEDEASRLKALATGVRDQDDLERDIGRQVGQQTSSIVFLSRNSPDFVRQINCF